MVEFALSKPLVVLVVEDEPLIREAAAEVLLESGFGVIEASNADEALLILEQRSDIGIVFTDIDMPGSMNGLNLAKVVRLRWPPIEVVLTSAKVSVPPERCAYIPKPYKFAEIVETLRNLRA